MPQLSREAVRVRELIEAIGPLIQAGDPSWRRLFQQAQRVASKIKDPFSADDAATRIGVIASHLLLLQGDYAGAQAQLEAALAAIERQRGRVGVPTELTRLTDHEWTLRLNLSQLLQQIGDWDAAAACAQRCLDLASSTLDPDARQRQSQVLVAALDLARHRLPEAVAGYRRAVDLYRTSEPDSLGVVLLGLAQAQLQSGIFADASVNLDRAEPLLAGDAAALASLQQARALIAAQTGDANAADQLRSYASEVGRGAELNPIHQQQARQAYAHAEHFDGDLPEAKARFDQVIQQARAAGDATGLADALARASTATQDLALTRHGSVDGEQLHRAALAQLSEAHQIVAGQDQPLKLASLDVALADYVAQWHQQVDGLNIALLRSALARADQATALLYAASLTAQTAPERRDFAALHAAHGFEVACTLAFRLGDKQTLARLINDRAARFNWQAVRR